jgi:hypothetical protein
VQDPDLKNIINSEPVQALLLAHKRDWAKPSGECSSANQSKYIAAADGFLK